MKSDEERKMEDEIIEKVEKELSKVAKHIEAIMLDVSEKHDFDLAYWGYKINLSFELYDRLGLRKKVCVSKDERPLEYDI